MECGEHVEEVGAGVEQVGVLRALARRDQHHGRQVHDAAAPLVGVVQLGGAAEGGEHVAEVVSGELVGDEGGRADAAGAEGALAVAVPYGGFLALIAGAGSEAVGRCQQAEVEDDVGAVAEGVRRSGGRQERVDAHAAPQPPAVRSGSRAAKVGGGAIPGIEHPKVEVCPACRIASCLGFRAL